MPPLIFEPGALRQRPMNEPTASKSDLQNERVALIACPVIGAVVFGIFGGFLLMASSVFGVNADWWYAAIPCGAVGLVVGWIGGLRWVRARREVRAAARAMGFRRLSARYREKIARRLKSMFTDTITVTSAMGRSLRRVRMVIAVMSRSSSSADLSSSRHSEQTIVWFESRSLDLPRFTLQPENSVVTFLGSFLGLEDFDFDDSPEFSRSYLLNGDTEDAVRALFSPEVRDYFASHSGWELMGHKTRLLLYRSRKVVGADELNGFVRDAVDMFRLMARNVRYVEEYRAGLAPITDRRGLAEALNVERPATGLVRAMSRTQLVTRDDLEAFLAQSRPRQLTPALQSRFATDLFMRIWSGVFIAAGIVGLIASCVLWGQRPEQFIVGGLGIAFATIGGVVLWLAGMSGRRAIRILTNGIPAQGQIESVQETSTVVGNQRQHQAHVRFNANGSTRVTKCNLYGGDAMRARELCEDDVSINILFDPSNPQRVLITDLLAVQS